MSVIPVLAPNSTWFTQGGTTVKRNTITQIDIKDTYTPTGTVTSSWDASAAKDGSVMCYVEGTKLTIAGNGSGKIMANADSSKTFQQFTNVSAILNANLLDTVNATTMRNMFDRSSKLAEVDVSSWNTSNVEDMSNMFQGCIALETLNLSNWDVSNVTAMSNMFMSMPSLGFMSLTSIGDVSEWDTGKVESMVAMFQACTSLKTLDLSGWNVSSVESMRNMFNSADKNTYMALETIGDVGNWNVSKVQDMYCMFQNCSSLSSLNTNNWVPSACKDMSYMFNNCSSLEEIDCTKWDVNLVGTMQSMFNDCYSLSSIGNTTNWQTESCTNMSFMFYKCFSLEELDVSNWDVSKVTNMNNMFGMPNPDTNIGSGNPALSKLDVSKWNTESCTNMSFMFYGCTLGSGNIDVYGWDVSKVTTFDHMFAHSNLVIGDISNWTPSTACTNMNAMFHSVKNTSFNVSKFNTSKVTTFEQMFQNASAFTHIIGLENFDTSSGLGFAEMFQNCYQVRELDLSRFDTTKAKDGAYSSDNGSTTLTMSLMFQNNHSLEKITLGSKFSFVGDGTTTNTSHHAVLHAPSASYITGADGNWYTRHREAYTPADIPSNTAMTYYASLDIVNNLDYLIKNESMLNLADKIRVLSGTEDTLTPSQMTSNVQSANDEVDTQSALIDQLSAALDGKAAGGGSDITTCTLKLSNNVVTSCCYMEVLNGEITAKKISSITSDIELANILCNSIVSITIDETFPFNWDGNYDLIFNVDKGSTGLYISFIINGDTSIEYSDSSGVL